MMCMRGLRSRRSLGPVTARRGKADIAGVFVALKVGLVVAAAESGVVSKIVAVVVEKVAKIVVVVAKDIIAVVVIVAKADHIAAKGRRATARIKLALPPLLHLPPPLLLVLDVFGVRGNSVPGARGVARRPLRAMMRTGTAGLYERDDFVAGLGHPLGDRGVGLASAQIDGTRK
jgi:hypothetical protein